MHFRDSLNGLGIPGNIWFRRLAVTYTRTYIIYTNHLIIYIYMYIYQTVYYVIIYLAYLNFVIKSFFLAMIILCIYLLSFECLLYDAVE